MHHPSAKVRNREEVDRLLLRGWAVTGTCGAYYRSLMPTRQEAIDAHCSDTGVDWDICKKNGDTVWRAEQRSIGEHSNTPEPRA